MSHVIEEFYGVYLLYNVNPDYKGRIYIGYTVNPDRRIQQHNAGREAGGAKKTSGRGPWEMVLTVHGFPNNISALRFEWAWQNPSFSRRLKHIPKKSRTESSYQFHFRILCEMLRTGPWNRLPLTIRWLKQDYQQEFPPNLLPPMHMPIAYGPVRLKKLKPSQKQATKLDTCPEEDLQHLDDPSTTSPNSLVWSEGLPLPTISKSWQRCSVCSAKITDVNSTLKCIHLSCHAISHIICLAGYFLNQSKTDPTKESPLIPIDGSCPNCCKEVLWGDLIRLKNGCYQNLVEGELNEKNSADNGDESDEDHWANALSQQC